MGEIQVSSQEEGVHRVQVLRSMFNPKGHGLEIGPSFRPVAPKKKGFDVETVDHAPADVLREKYQNKPVVAVNQIEEVDHVWNGGSLVDLIGKKDAFDYIIASHVIEHTTDLVRFLNDCETLIKPDGVLVLAVPDKRYCSDFFRPLASTGQVIQAYMEKRDRHSVAAIFDSWSLLTRNGPLQSWEKANLPDELRMCSGPDRAFDKLQLALATEDYVDAHEWCFTPSSFRLILSDLRQLSLSELSEEMVIDGASCEFFVQLRKNISSRDVDRLSLSKAYLDESASVAPSSLRKP